VLAEADELRLSQPIDLRFILHLFVGKVATPYSQRLDARCEKHVFNSYGTVFFRLLAFGY
jgi:hypothetical protein